jgi:hypothetical protein
MSTIQQAPAPAPDQPRPRVSRGLLLAVLLSFAVAVAIVVTILVLQRSDHRDSTIVTPGGPGSTNPAVQTDQQKIAAVYVQYLDAVFSANSPPNPNHPLLEVYTTGPQLAATREAIAQKLQDGVTGRRPANSVATSKLTSVTVDGDHADFTSCDVGDWYFVNVDTGETVGPEGVGTFLVTGEMERDAVGVWKVSALTYNQTWEGVAGCALAS